MGWGGGDLDGGGLLVAQRRTGLEQGLGQLELLEGGGGELCALRRLCKVGPLLAAGAGGLRGV